MSDELDSPDVMSDGYGERSPIYVRTALVLALIVTFFVLVVEKTKAAPALFVGGER